jgi:hypothetical protein
MFNTRTKPDSTAEVTDLETQLTLLTVCLAALLRLLADFAQHYDVHDVAKSHILLKLHKHPLLKSTTLLTSITSLLQAVNNSTASTSNAQELAGKVENRLCSAKTVADGVKASIAWLVGAEGARLPSKAKPVGGKHGGRKVPGMAAENDISDDEEDAEDIQEDEGRASFGKTTRPIAVEMSEEDQTDDGEAAGWESGSLSGDAEKVKSQTATKRVKPTLNSKSSAPPKQKEAKVKARTKAQPPETGTITASTFLPSLSTGFTLGSDDEDDTPFDEDAGEIPLRKNRRGQRARQA